jgi:hypothetical protein
MSRRLLGVFLFLSLLFAVLPSRPVRGQQPSPPPDIQAILNKQNSGQKLTQDDMQKLMQWAQQATQQFMPMKALPGASVPTPSMPAGMKLPVTPGSSPTPTAEPIPVTATVTLHYDKVTTGKDGYVARSSLDLTTTQDLIMVASIGGIDDYYKGFLDPNAHKSYFLFSPAKTPDGKALKTPGFGTYDRQDHITHQCDPKHGMGVTEDQYHGSYTTATGGFMLTSAGSDLLWPGADNTAGGGFSGARVGTHTSVDSCSHKPGTTVTGVDDDMLAVSPPFVWEAHISKPNQPRPRPRIQISYRKLVAALGSGTTTPVAASENFGWTETTAAGSVTMDGNAKMTLVFRPPESGLVIDAADQEKFKAWLPLPIDSRYTESGQPGSLLEMNVHFTDPSVAAPITMSLDEVSGNRGICDNDPVDGTQKQGLKFAAQSKQPAGLVIDDDQHAHTPDAVTGIHVMIEAQDTAAFGKLNARSAVKNLTARFKKIPLDDNNNDIADAWEKRPDVAVFERNLPANWDEEDSPPGASTGDGLTLYEEYRGIMLSADGVNEQFTRLPSNLKKEFFQVLSAHLPNNIPKPFDLRPVILQGLQAHQTIMHDKVLIFRMASELKPNATTVMAAGLPLTTYQMNPNSDPDDHRYFHNKHYAVDVRAIDPDEDDKRRGARGTVPNMQGDAAHNAQSPDDSAGIFLRPAVAWEQAANDVYWFNGSHHASPEEAFEGWIESGNPDQQQQYPDAWLREAGLTHQFMADRLTDPDVLSQLTAQEMVYTVLHESGHTLGFHHHGLNSTGDTLVSTEYGPSTPPRTCPMYYPRRPARLEFLSGRWDLTQALEIDWPEDLNTTGWLRAERKAPYQFCVTADQGGAAGGIGAPRYKNRD